MTISGSFDYVIVGSGAAGATAARVLADTGASIAVLEEGPAVETKGFGDRLFPVLRDMFRDQGAQVARGRTLMPVIQGRCLGGSTVINSAIVWRLPDDVWEPWKTEFGLGDALPLDELHSNWDQIEQELSIVPTPEEAWGGNNRIMERAATKMGISAAPTGRNVHDCRGSARCQYGCPFGAKRSMLVTYIPYSRERGTTFFTSAKVDKVLMDGSRAVGVSGRSLDGREPFQVRARKAVIVAASAIQTPGILARSGVRSRHLGNHFQGHPGVPIMGVFDERVDMWAGATQGYDADEHRKDWRLKVETLSLPIEMILARLPGVGKDWLDNIARSTHMTSWAVQMRASGRGKIRDRFFGTDIRFAFSDEDIVNIRRGIRFAAEMLFEAGAKEVLPFVYGMPETIRSIDEARAFEDGPKDPRSYTWAVSHMFGTARMSLAARDGVVGPDFSVHGTENLYVVDSSVFPTNTGVNPQHTIMGVAMLAAKRLAAA